MIDYRLKGERSSLIIPGLAVLATRMAMGDVDEWLKKDIVDEWVRTYFKPQGKEERKPGEAETPAVSIGVFRMVTEIASPRERLNEHTRFYTIVGEDPTIVYEFVIEVNCRVYGLVNSLTPKWREVLWKRLVEHKSLTQIALEMKVKPQAVVAFMASIRKAVQKHLYQTKKEYQHDAKTSG